MAWLKSRSTITQEDSMSHHLGVDDIWRRLLGGFRIIGPIEFYESITRGFIRKFLGTLAQDGVRWVEMRGMTRNVRLEGEDTPKENRLELVRALSEETENFMRSEEWRQLLGARLTWDTSGVLIRNY